MVGAPAGLTPSNACESASTSRMVAANAGLPARARIRAIRALCPAGYEDPLRVRVVLLGDALHHFAEERHIAIAPAVEEEWRYHRLHNHKRQCPHVLSGTVYHNAITEDAKLSRVREVEQQGRLTLESGWMSAGRWMM